MNNIFVVLLKIIKNFNNFNKKGGGASFNFDVNALHLWALFILRFFMLTKFIQ